MTTSLSLAHQRKNKQTIKKKKNSTNLTNRKLAQTPGPTLGGQKSKGRNISTLKTGKRRPQTQLVKKQFFKKAEIYYTNEGTNQKHRSPNK